MRKISVLEFCSQIGAASDDIPVVVKAGSKEIGRFQNLHRIPSVAAPGVLEAKITFVSVMRAEIIIQVRVGSFTTK